MSAGALRAALAEHGIACDVEAHDALAVLVPRTSPAALATADRRELALRLAREHGFTHVAVELPASPGGA